MTRLGAMSDRAPNGPRGMVVVCSWLIVAIAVAVAIGFVYTVWFK
jgi:hypothetical protein